MFSTPLLKRLLAIVFMLCGVEAYSADTNDQASLASVDVEQARDLALEELEDLRDPTAPLTMNTGRPLTNLFSMFSSYKVTSILIRQNMKVAVINSRQVREGDTIGNAEVVSIDKDSVTLQVAGEEKILELYGRSIKTLNKD